MVNGEWLDEMVNWLEGFPWQWFVTLTTRPGLSEVQLRWRLLRWADELREALGTQDFEWIAVPERGVTGWNFHFHVLIGGLKPGCGAAERLEWMRRWYKIAGDAQIEDYQPDAGGVRYILKHVGPWEFDQIEFRLKSKAPLLSKAGAK